MCISSLPGKRYHWPESGVVPHASFGHILRALVDNIKDIGVSRSSWCTSSTCGTAVPGRSYFAVVPINRSRTPIISFYKWSKCMYEACCCCAAAAVVDLSSSAYAYPLAVLSLLRPRLILPYLHLSVMSGTRGAAAEYDVPVCV